MVDIPHKKVKMAGCVLQDLRTRGITEVDLIVTDGRDGLLAAVSVLFTATPRQRWKVA